LGHLSFSGVEGGNEICPIVHSNMRFVLENFMNVRIIGSTVFPFDGKNGKAIIFRQRSCYIILSGKGVRGTEEEFAPT